MKMKKLAALAVAGVMASGPALAEQANVAKLYVLAGIPLAILAHVIETVQNRRAIAT